MLRSDDWLLAIASLRKTGIFEEVEGDVDEEEHSLEMHLPYIRHVFAGQVAHLHLTLSSELMLGEGGMISGSSR